MPLNIRSFATASTDATDGNVVYQGAVRPLDYITTTSAFDHNREMTRRKIALQSATTATPRFTRGTSYLSPFGRAFEEWSSRLAVPFPEVVDTARQENSTPTAEFAGPSQEGTHWTIDEFPTVDFGALEQRVVAGLDLCGTSAVSASYAVEDYNHTMRSMITMQTEYGASFENYETPSVPDGGAAVEQDSLQGTGCIPAIDAVVYGGRENSYLRVDPEVFRIREENLVPRSYGGAGRAGEGQAGGLEPHRVGGYRDGVAAGWLGNSGSWFGADVGEGVQLSIGRSRSR